MPEGQYSYQTGDKNTFSIVDYVIFGCVLAFSAGIGVFYAIRDRRKATLNEFLMAGRSMNPITVAMSLVASFMSAITLLGTPAEMFSYTTMYWWIGLSYFFVMGGAAHIFLPIFYNMKLTSAYEYLEKRFSKGVRTCGSMTFCVQMMLYMAIVLYAPSLALNAVTNFTLWGSVISVGTICTIYTAIGGMKAVLWTDTFQVCMMLAGLLAILIRGSMVVGGFAAAWEIARENERVWFTDFSPDPSVRHSVWSLVVGGYFTWVAIYGTNQAQVQRCLTCPTLKKAQIALWLNFPGLCIILLLSCLIGMVVFAFYSRCDPQSVNLIGARDQLLPLFVMDVMPDIVGLPGLFVACIFSGALSTVSSGLNSLAAVILEDVIRAYIGKEMSEKRATTITKVTALILGAVCLGLSYVASLLGGVLQAALSLFGIIGGPLLGLFTLGMIFPWANKWGAFAGWASGLVMMLWIGVGAQVVKPAVKPIPPPISTVDCNWNITSTTMPTTLAGMTTTLATTTSNVTSVADISPDYYLYTLSYMWYSATAVLVVLVVGLIVSFATGHTKASEVDARLICPFFDIIPPFCWLPECIRKPLRFGVNHEGKYDRPEFSEKYADSKITGEKNWTVNSPGSVEEGNNVTEKTGKDNPNFNPPPYSETEFKLETKL